MLQMVPDKLKGFSEKNIGDLLALVQPILSHRQELHSRYARKNGPNELMSGGEIDGKERAIVAFEYYIVNMVQGYLGGKAPMYSVRKGQHKESYPDEYKDAIEEIRRYNDDAATFIELIHDYLITTAAHLYIFEDKDNEIRYVRFDSRQTVAIFDYSTPPNQIGNVRVWEDDDTTVIEVITDAQKTQYRQGGDTYKAETPETFDWKDVPCVAFENPDGIAVFEPALSPIDTYEQLVNNVRNMTQYNDDAKLLVSGYQPAEPLTVTDEKTGAEVPNPKRKTLDETWLKAVTMFVGENGNVSWLLKQVDYSGTLSLEKSLHDLITMLTGVPNMTDDAFSNADNASALGYKLYALDQYSAATDRVFRKGYLRLWEIITSRLNEKRGMRGMEPFDFRDIDIAMQRNIPTDKDKSIARAVQMKQSGLFSDETCINESQVEVDAKEEITRRDEEEQADYERIRERNEQMTVGRDDTEERQSGFSGIENGVGVMTKA